MSGPVSFSNPRIGETLGVNKCIVPVDKKSPLRGKQEAGERGLATQGELKSLKKVVTYSPLSGRK